MKKSTKTLLAALSLAIATPAIVAPLSIAPQEVQAATLDFKDVPKDYVYYDIINEMRDKKVIEGYEDNTFRPQINISRQHAAVLVERVKELKPAIALSEYKDIPKSYRYYSAIMKLQRTGIIENDGYQRFNPTKPLTRGEMAQILANAFELESSEMQLFSDVKKGTKLSKAVSALYSYGITTGYDDGTFRPDEPLSRAHYSVFLYRALKNEEPKPEVISNTDVNTSFVDFVEAIKGDPVYKLERPLVVGTTHEQEYNIIRFRKILTEGRKFVAETNLYYAQAGINIYFRHLKNDATINVTTKGTELHFYVDYRNVETVDLARKLFKLAYPELDVDDIFYVRAKEAREAYAKEWNVPAMQREFKGNASTIKQNGFAVKIGANSFLDTFYIEVSKL